MEVHELSESVEKSRETGERTIGLTMAIFAILLAAATMLCERADTDQVLLETQATDQWNYYQAKDIRSHVYDADSGLAKMFGDKGAALAADFASQSVKQKNDAEKIQVVAVGYEKEAAVAGKRATYYERSELLLEISIVLCSVSLLSLARVYWKFSFLFAVAGLAMTLWAILRVH